MLTISFTKNLIIAIVIPGLLTGHTGCKKPSSPDPVSAVSMEEFGTRLDELRKQSNIPGMVAGIVKDGQVTWTATYGYENMAQQK